MRTARGAPWRSSFKLYYHGGIRMKNTTAGHAAALTANLFFGLNMPVAKALLSGISLKKT